RRWAEDLAIAGKRRLGSLPARHELKNIRTGRPMSVHPPVFRQISGWEFPILHPSAINLSRFNLRLPASRMP
ncbi:MAG TPA: hypothetical protein VJ349_24865, partial [Stellaceae bacterium]|nr:hypothetical protein [Stellaceae bacterium]